MTDAELQAANKDFYSKLWYGGRPPPPPEPTPEQATAAAAALQQARNDQAKADAQPLTMGGMRQLLSEQSATRATAAEQDTAAKVANYKNRGLSDGEALLAATMKLPGE